MKNLIIAIALVAMLVVSCAESKTFKKSDGTEFIAHPYGWIDKENRIEGVEYDLCAENIVWSCILGETVIAPILFTGLALWEPVSYNEPPKSNITNIK